MERLKDNVTLVRGLFPRRREGGEGAARVLREVVVYGSAHNSEAQAQEAGELVLERRPAAVLLEICSERARDLEPYLRDSWLDALFRRRLSSGLDAVAAWRAARAVGSRVVFGDRPFSEIQRTRREAALEAELHEARLEDFLATSFLANRNARLFEQTEDLAERRALLEEWASYPDPMWREMGTVYRCLAHPEDRDEFFAACLEADKLVSPTMYRYDRQREDHMLDRILDAHDAPSMVAVVGRCHLRPLEAMLSAIVLSPPS